MNNANEIRQLITDPECDVETEEIQDLEGEGHLNVIPFHLIKLSRDVEIEEEPTNSQIEHSSKFETIVRGKYSKYYKQTYRPAWENMPDFKGWLKGVKGQPTRAYCTYCRKTLHAHRLSLLKHTCTVRHQKAAQLHGNPTDPTNRFINVSSNDIQSVIVNEEGALAEDNSDDLMQSHIVYTSQDDLDVTENNVDQLDQGDDSGECEATSSSAKEHFNDSIHAPISTHVIDTTRGAPVLGLSVSLYKLVDGRWTYINEGLTDSKGRCSSFFKNGKFSAGRYKLHYDVDRYFESRKQESLFPFIETIFDSPPVARCHFSLLLGPNSYTTYRSTQE